MSEELQQQQQRFFSSIVDKPILRNLLLMAALMSISLIIGILGYHYLGGLVWIDALHTASMILSGMGPVTEIKYVRGKIFSSIYALFSGIVFISSIGLILEPEVHRLSRALKLDETS